MYHVVYEEQHLVNSTMDLSRYPMNGFSKTMLLRRFGHGLFFMVALVSLFVSTAEAQEPHSEGSDRITVQGRVLSSEGKPVVGASVRLEQPGALEAMETKTDTAGIFRFRALRSGRYLIDAKQAGLRSHGDTVLLLSEGDRKSIDLTIGVPVDSQLSTGVPSHSLPDMEFSDAPHFTIAGVTDWTAVGGHGSDSTLRTSEDLARETLTLKPQDSRDGTVASGDIHEGDKSEDSLRGSLAKAPSSLDANHQLGEFYLHAGRYEDAIPMLRSASQIDPGRDDNAYDLALAYEGAGELQEAREQVRRLLARKDTVDLHRLAGELDEKLNDPFAAVQEYERAVRLGPSEQNYFAWGSELLLHRAVWQAVEVFRDGAKLYPKSTRMLTAWGTALFAGAVYDQAALRLCEASDLNPASPEPYVFMGKLEMAAPAPLPCVKQKLARFVQEQPQNALADYLYAMSLLKSQEQSTNRRDLQEIESLLRKSVTIDPKCVDAYLQLGILYSSRREYEKAIGFYTKAIEVDPQLSEAHYRLGVAYDRTSESAKAQKEFQLHDEIERRQAAAVEDQRREIKQFVVVPQGQRVPSAVR
jgi:tetratricopeptide (TPR) repeat protein